jgi:lysophospholipase L1-like esterase
LLLGDSTTFGWGVGQGETFAARLEARLNQRAGHQPRWQVINAGVPAYSSCQLRVAAAALIPRWRPAYVVVCTGNNEAWPVERSDASIYLNRGAAARFAVAMLESSRLLGWLAQSLVPDRPRPYRAPPARLAVPRVSEAQLADNLRAIDALARRHGARLIIIGPTVNLYHPPIERELLRVADTADHRANPDAPPSPEALADLARWRADDASIEAMLDARQHADAVEEAQRLARANPDDFRYVWLQGIARSAAGDEAEGRALLESAFARLPYPDRARQSCRAVIEATARAIGAPWIEPNALFRDAAAPALPLGYYLDWCHPSAAGHALIAEALSQIIAL